MSERPKGIIYDLGYRPYEGRYLGRAPALLSLVWDDFKRALGVKKSWRYKFAIIALLVIELGIFFFFLLTSQLADVFGPTAPQTMLNPYSGLYEALASVLLFLSALVAPNLLCDDRRYRVYPLYLARPIHADDYLLAKGGAVFGVLTLMVLGPALLLFLGKILLASDALQYLQGHQRDLWALIASGLLIALFYTSLAMGISSLTTRRGYAAGALIGIVFLLGIVSSMFLFTLRAQWAPLVDIDGIVLRVKDLLFFGELSRIDVGSWVIEPLHPGIYVIAMLGVMALSWAITRLSYLREVR